MKYISILGINGAPNKKGLCSSLLKECLGSVEKHGGKTKIIHLIDVLKEFYHSKYSKKPEKDFKKLYNLILRADGMVLATPVYWNNVSSLMKNFIEKLTVFEIRNFKLEGKAVGFITTAEEDGAWKAILDMAGPLNHMGLISPPYAMNFYHIKFANKSEKNWMRKDISLLGKNMVELCKVLKSSKPDWDYPTFR